MSQNPLQVDEYLSTMTEQERARLRERMGPHRLDQATAAVEEAKELAVAITPRRTTDVLRQLDYNEIPEWLRLNVAALMCEWTEGKATTCVHRPSPDVAAPVVGAAWKPHTVVCDACVHLLTVTDPVVDNTCDGCGHLCKGMPDDGIRPVALTFGMLVYRYGLCTDCDKDSPQGTLP